MGIATYNFVYPALLIGPVVLLVSMTKTIEITFCRIAYITDITGYLPMNSGPVIILVVLLRQKMVARFFADDIFRSISF